jgi:hypothetical protein
MANATDLQMLQGLLTLPLGKLPATEKRAFQAMYDNLVNGFCTSLSPKQRDWVLGAFLKNDKPIATRVPPTKDPGKPSMSFGPIPKPIR